jgi:hypothetical protein
MARGRNIAALAALLGAGALASSKKALEDSDTDTMEFLRRYQDSNLKMLPSEERAVRRKVFAEEPGLRNVVRSEEVYPVSTGSGTFLRSGMKKGGKVMSASKRADGMAKRGKTRGKMV